MRRPFEQTPAPPAEDEDDNFDFFGGEVIAGFEGKPDPRGGAIGRPDTLGRGVDPERQRTDVWGPLSISALVIALLALIVLAVLIANAARRFHELGKVHPGRAKPWHDFE